MAFHTSSNGINLITSFEGFVGHPYRDAVGVWTIGYGHTEGVGPGSKSISQAEAYALLRRDLANKYEPYVNALKLPLNQNQYDALVSFVYNLGPGYFGPGHTIGDALRRRNWNAAANAILLYDKAGGRALPGLTRRRRTERALFLKPVGPASPLAHLRAWLAARQAQLKVTKDKRRRAWLIGRINALKARIKRGR